MLDDAPDGYIALINEVIGKIDAINAATPIDESYAIYCDGVVLLGEEPFKKEDFKKDKDNQFDFLKMQLSFQRDIYELAPYTTPSAEEILSPATEEVDPARALAIKRFKLAYKTLDDLMENQGQHLQDQLSNLRVKYIIGKKANFHDLLWAQWNGIKRAVIKHIQKHADIGNVVIDKSVFTDALNPIKGIGTRKVTKDFMTAMEESIQDPDFGTERINGITELLIDEINKIADIGIKNHQEMKKKYRKLVEEVGQTPFAFVQARDLCEVIKGMTIDSPTDPFQALYDKQIDLIMGMIDVELADTAQYVEPDHPDRATFEGYRQTLEDEKATLESLKGSDSRTKLDKSMERIGSAVMKCDKAVKEAPRRSKVWAFCVGLAYAILNRDPPKWVSDVRKAPAIDPTRFMEVQRTMTYARAKAMNARSLIKEEKVIDQSHQGSPKKKT